MSDSFLHDALATIVTLLLCSYLVYRLLTRSRPDMKIGTAVAAAMGLRGGDEVGFLIGAGPVWCCRRADGA